MIVCEMPRFVRQALLHETKLPRNSRKVERVSRLMKQPTELAVVAV